MYYLILTTGRIRKMVLNEELHAKYPLDLAQEVLDKLAGRSDCTLGRVQRDVIGPVPGTATTPVISLVTSRGETRYSFWTLRSCRLAGQRKIWPRRSWISEGRGMTLVDQSLRDQQHPPLGLTWDLR